MDRETKIQIIVVMVIISMSLLSLYFEIEIKEFEFKEKIFSLQHEIKGNERIIGQLKKRIEMQGAYIEVLKKMHKVIECESNYKHEVYGDGGKAYGIAQFHKPTFHWLSKKAGLKLKYRNRGHQILLLKWAIENGKGKYWTCYRRCCFTAGKSGTNGA